MRADGSLEIFPTNFGSELLRNWQTGELRRSGIRVRLQEQPFRVLATLLSRPGELVTRDELKQELWSDSEFGDFDQGLNVAIKKIRVALGNVPIIPGSLKR